jgi:flavodoxin
MNACVLYFSLTGNTKRFAEATSTHLDIPVFDLAKTEPLIVEEFEMLIFGTPVHGLSPAKPVSNFIAKMPKANNKKTIIFTTYAIRKGKANEKLENDLSTMGYQTILSLSKRGIKLSENDFSDSIMKIESILGESK